MKKLSKILLLGITASAMALGGMTIAQADEYPSRPVEIVVTFGPGGGADAMGRKMSQLLEKQLGVPLPVSNIAGASGNAGLTKVLTNPADGYTLGTLIALSVSSWASGLGTARPDDFTVIAVTQDSPSMLFVSKSSPLKTFQDFLDAAKANPGKLKIATSGYGTQDDMTLKYLAAQGYETTNVPFSKPSERYASPLGGHTDAIYEEPGDVAPLLKGGQLRPLVVFDDVAHPAFPDTPTSLSHGFHISDLPNFRTLAVPSSTPQDIVDRLSSAVQAALATSEWKEFCESTYTCTKEYSPEESQAHVISFYKMMQHYAEKYK
ncbi:MAG: tripartite tricarboxylate transporter substrate binding protein [Castellaniella sp.]